MLSCLGPVMPLRLCQTLFFQRSAQLLSDHIIASSMRLLRGFVVALASCILAALGFFLSVVGLAVSPLVVYFQTTFPDSDLYSMLAKDAAFERRRCCASTNATLQSCEDPPSSDTHSSTRPEPSDLHHLDTPRDPPIPTLHIPPPADEAPQVHSSSEQTTLRSPSRGSQDDASSPRRTTSLPLTYKDRSRQPKRSTSGMLGSYFPHFRKPGSSKRPERAASAYEPLLTSPLITSNTASHISNPPDPILPSALSGVRTSTGSPSASKRTSSVPPKKRPSTNLSPKQDVTSPSPPRLLRRPHSTCPKLLASFQQSTKDSEQYANLVSVPRARPYEAPYFFPPPGSIEAVGYVEKTREVLRKAHQRADRQDSPRSSPQGRSLTLPADAVRATGGEGEARGGDVPPVPYLDGTKTPKRSRRRFSKSADESRDGKPLAVGKG